jgi:predicted O-methyltransferase YrrM
MADNAFAFGELFAEKPTNASTPDMRAFNEVMAREKALHSIIVPIGDGLWVGVKG